MNWNPDLYNTDYGQIKQLPPIVGHEVTQEELDAIFKDIKEPGVRLLNIWGSQGYSGTGAGDRGLGGLGYESTGDGGYKEWYNPLSKPYDWMEFLTLAAVALGPAALASSGVLAAGGAGAAAAETGGFTAAELALAESGATAFGGATAAGATGGGTAAGATFTAAELALADSGATVFGGEMAGAYAPAAIATPSGMALGTNTGAALSAELTAGGGGLGGAGVAAETGAATTATETGMTAKDYERLTKLGVKAIKMMTAKDGEGVEGGQGDWSGYKSQGFALEDTPLGEELDAKAKELSDTFVKAGETGDYNLALNAAKDFETTAVERTLLEKEIFKYSATPEYQAIEPELRVEAVKALESGVTPDKAVKIAYEKVMKERKQREFLQDFVMRKKLEAAA